MTAALAEPPSVTQDWPEGALYHSPRGLFPFQADCIAECYVEMEYGGGELIVWDTGTGKSHFGLATAALLEEDVRAAILAHDITFVVCERNKVKEWVDDFGRFTRLSARAHHGAGRAKALAKEGLPDVIVTTYETGKADMAKSEKNPNGRGTHIVPGPLYAAVEGKSVLWIFDEIGKLRNRSSANYKAYDWILGRMRKAKPTSTRVIGMTATPIERDWEDAFNIGRLIRPDLMPLVKDFDARYVRNRDPYGRARYNKFLMPEFAALFVPFLKRKRKTDPDVREQFPKIVEESQHLEMGPEQTHLYELVASLGDRPDDDDGTWEPPPALWTTLRMVAGHPSSLVHAARHGQSSLIKMIVEEIGEERLLAIPSVKEQWLLDYLDPLVNGQGAKAMVFTFFGPSMIPVLARTLRSKKFKVYEYRGDMTPAAQDDAKDRFRADPDPCVMLCSDAAARGINVPEAGYIVEFESALTYANRTQRINRAHRIDATSVSLTCMTAIVDFTVEVAIIQNMIERNEQTDVLLGDDDDGAGSNYMTADKRKAALAISRLSKKRKK